MFVATRTFIKCISFLEARVSSTKEKKKEKKRLIKTLNFKPKASSSSIFYFTIEMDTVKMGFEKNKRNVKSIKQNQFPKSKWITKKKSINYKASSCSIEAEYKKNRLWPIASESFYTIFSGWKTIFRRTKFNVFNVGDTQWD